MREEKENSGNVLSLGNAKPVSESPKIENTAPQPVDDWRRMPVIINWQEKSRLILEINRSATKVRFRIAPFTNIEEGETFNRSIFRDMLEKCRITYGIDNKVVEEMFSEVPLSLPYNTPVIIAVGKEAVNGIDGVVKELFPRVNKPRLEERADGTIDFKNLHVVNNIEKGTVICEITHPIQGTAGTSVYGTNIRPVPARNPMIPRGENVDLVEVDEGHSKLVAAIDGNLVFKNERFCVESVFTVAGNVDISTGNIEFTGNVVVKGDVYEGFSIKTDRDVTVYGTVEGASIFAGGNINLIHGINGMNKGVLESKGNINAKFLENCTVRSGGDIIADNIINCNIETDQNITLSGHGALIGGRIMAFGSIEAKTIGSRSNTPTHISLGITPHMLHERENLRAQYKQALAEYESLTRDVIFLSQEKYAENPEVLKKLELYRGKLNLATFKKNRLENKVRQLTAQQEVTVPSTLTCTTAYPPLYLSIGEDQMILRDPVNMCRFYRSESGEITMGSK